jgi:glycolate oxidase
MATETKEKPKTRNIEKFKDEILRCIRCSYCSVGCPGFEELGWETATAKGKISMAYGLLTGELKPSHSIARRLFQCTLCKNCFEKCTSKVQGIEIVQAARADIIDAGFAIDPQCYMVDNVKKTGNIFGDEEVMTPAAQGETPVFIGCQYLSRPNKTKAYLRILDKLGIKPKVYEEVCCGFPMKALGFVDDLEEQKEKFHKAFPVDGDSPVVALCPTCALFLKEEYDLKAEHVLTAMVKKLKEIEPKQLGLKATYHDPCDLSRGIGLIDEPREILRLIGVDLVEMPNHGVESKCCGGGGGILVSDGELSDQIALDRVREAISTGADLLVTACPTCEQTLKKAAATLSERGEGEITVRRIADLVFKAIK